MNKKLVLMLMVASVFILFSCKRESHVTNKFDPALRHFMESSQIESAAEKSIPVIGTCSSQISDSLRSVLERAGARIGTISGRFFTADIPKSKLEKIALLKQIRYLQLAPKAKPTK